jgi:hypothetical protein
VHDRSQSHYEHGAVDNDHPGSADLPDQYQHFGRLHDDHDHGLRGCVRHG